MKIRSLFDNLEIKLICLLLAIVMWLYANKLTGSWWPFQGQTQKSEITFRNVPVKLTGDEWEAVPREIEIKCRAMEVEIGSLQAVVDLTQADEDDGWVTLTADNVKLPEGLEFMRAKPAKVQISPLQQSEITFREVPVKLVGIQNAWEAVPKEIEIKCLAMEVEIGNLQVVVTLTPADEENRLVILSAENVELPEGLEFVRARPAEVKISPIR